MRFDDFDAWGEAVSGASLRLVCDAVETPEWTLGILDLGGVVLQLACEGGGNLCYGANTHVGPTLFIPLTHAAGHVVNGVALDEESLLAIPRGSDFSIRVRRRAHAWCSIALPEGFPALDASASGSGKLACPPGTVRALKRLVHEIAHALIGRTTGTAAHRSARIAVQHAVAACASGQTTQPAVAGRPQLDRADMIRRAMAAIEASQVLPTAAELARLAGVNDRTLLRAFHERYGVPPKKYLMLRELHLIRRALTRGAPGDETVADVLTRHGIWEFGRFAGRYRSHFGELPSATLRKARS